MAVLQRMGRDRVAMVACLALVAAIGWSVLATMSADTDMVGPAGAAALMPHKSNVGFATVLLMWMAMIAAMMAPATGPGLSAYLMLARRRCPERSTVPAASGFFAGYMTAWLSYAALGAFAQWTLSGAALLSPMGTSTSTWLSASIVAAAGLYQLTPLKRICVSRCRNPLLQLMGAWRDGVPGALQLGLKQGSWCIGCCWALMTLMFVVGLMNLVWMAVLAVFFLAEKLVPVRWQLDTAMGVLLLAAAAFLGLQRLV